MLISSNNYNLFFNIDKDLEDNSLYFKFDNISYNISYNKIVKFIDNSTLQDIKIDNGEEDFWDFIDDNFQYINISINPLIRKITYYKITKVILDNKWVLDNPFLKHKIKSLNKKDDLYTNLLFIIMFLKTVNQNKLKNNSDEYFYTIEDFLFQ